MERCTEYSASVDVTLQLTTVVTVVKPPYNIDMLRTEVAAVSCTERWEAEIDYFDSALTIFKGITSWDVCGGAPTHKKSVCRGLRRHR